MKTRKYLNLIHPLLAVSLCACTLAEPSVTITTPAPPTQTQPPTETPADTPTPIPTSEAPGQEGWLMYTNEEYGFSFSYPAQFEVLTDADSLAGWEKGVLLLYNGGHSYDIVVQVWDSQNEIDLFYGVNNERLHVFPIGKRILTVMNITLETGSNEIIESLVFEQ